MIHKYSLFFFSFLSIHLILAQGYKVEGNLPGIESEEVYLGYFFGDKQYLLDTSKVIGNKILFEDTVTLKPGVYMIVFPPENKFFQLMVNEKEQHFQFSVDTFIVDDISNHISFTNSDDNELFYSHVSFLDGKRNELQEIKDEQTSAEEADKSLFDDKIETLNHQVEQYQDKIITEHPDFVTSLLIKSSKGINVPEFEGNEQEVQEQKYLYYKKHYFDNLDLSHPALVRTPKNIFHDKVMYYLEKLTPQHPDSLKAAVDYLLGKMEGSEENYRYFLVSFFNYFASSKFVGMDAVYVHLAENYYARGKAPWMDEEQRNKIITEAMKAKPTLIGQIAPNIVVQKRDSSDLALHEIESPYLVLIFWAHDCGHCQKSMPALKDFYLEYKEKGVEVLAVCTKLLKEEPACWDYIDEHELDLWINTSDKKGGASLMHSYYNLQTTPRIFVLDQNKKILSKGIGVEQLAEVMEQIFEMENN